MLTFLGVIAIVFALVMSFIYPSLRKEDSESDRFGNYKPKAPNILLMWNSKMRLMIASVGLFLILFSQSFFIARESKQYYILNKANGNRTAVTTPGMHFITPFVTEIREWDKYLEVKGVKVDKDGNLLISEKEAEALKDVEGVMKGGVSVRFIDKVTADVYPSVRFSLPSDPALFIKIVERYRTPENLVMNTLVPIVSEQLKNITFMFTADEYVSGGATIYRSEIEEVLKNGGYVFAKETIRDTIYEPSISGDTVQVKNRKRSIREIKVFEKNKKVIKGGVALRKQHEASENSIFTDQVIIDDINLDPKYEAKLKEQMALSAQTVVENQKVITAKSAQMSILAEGERDKAKERVKREKEQVSQLIEIETSVKKEESKRQLAEIAVRTAELESKATKIAADAEAYKNAKLVSAGLTPLERAMIEKETKIGVAKELSKMGVPQNVIIGGNGNGNATEALLQTKLLKDLTDK